MILESHSRVMLSCRSLLEVIGHTAVGRSEFPSRGVINEPMGSGEISDAYLSQRD